MLLSKVVCHDFEDLVLALRGPVERAIAAEGHVEFTVVIDRNQLKSVVCLGTSAPWRGPVSLSLVPEPDGVA